jgi:hypothetical protein
MDTMRREDLARAVAEAVTAVPGVAALVPGPPDRVTVEASTQFSGGKVIGLRLSTDPVEVHIRADRVPLPPVAEAAATAARTVLAAAGDDRPVRVIVDDVVADAIGRRSI